MVKRNKLVGSAVIATILIVFTCIGVVKYIGESSDAEDMFIEMSAAEKTDKTYSSSKESNENSSDTLSKKYIKVEIKGEISKPGVYTMNTGSRLEDLISKAGGFTDKADTNSIPSMARKLKDEECVIIYSMDQDKSTSVPVVKPPEVTSPETELININTASEEELKNIPGVGDTIAKSIIDYREKNGLFESIEDIKKVQRIGDKTYEKMKDKITVY